MAHAGGRPTDYKPEYCQLIKKEMGENGLSLTRFASKIKVHKDTVYEWAKKHEQFSVALREAQQDCESYWEAWLTNNLENKNINPGLAKLYMTNRFGWSDRVEQNTHITFTQEEWLKGFKE